MKEYLKLQRKAIKLIAKLQNDITTGQKQICEDYGQQEIRKFEDKELCYPNDENLTYQETCNIKDILYKVSSIC